MWHPHPRAANSKEKKGMVFTTAITESLIKNFSIMNNHRRREDHLHAKENSVMCSLNLECNQVTADKSNKHKHNISENSFWNISFYDSERHSVL